MTIKADIALFNVSALVKAQFHAGVLKVGRTTVFWGPTLSSRLRREFRGLVRSRWKTPRPGPGTDDRSLSQGQTYSWLRSDTVYPAREGDFWDEEILLA